MYNVGDTVKIVKCDGKEWDYSEYLGKSFKIKDINPRFRNGRKEYVLDPIDDIFWLDEELALVKRADMTDEEIFLGDEVYIPDLIGPEQYIKYSYRGPSWSSIKGYVVQSKEAAKSMRNTLLRFIKNNNTKRVLPKPGDIVYIPSCINIYSSCEWQNTPEQINLLSEKLVFESYSEIVNIHEKMSSFIKNKN